MPDEQAIVIRSRRLGVIQAAAFSFLGLFLGGLCVEALAKAGDSGWATVLSWAGVAANVVLLVAAVRSLIQRAVVEPDQIRIRNILTSRTVRWDQVDDIVTKIESTASGVWWGTHLVLRDRDRIVRIQASFTRDEATAQSIAAELRSRIANGPTTTTTTTTTVAAAATAPAWPVVPIGNPVSRPRSLVLRSWAFSAMGWFWLVVALGSPVLLILLVSGIVAVVSIGNGEDVVAAVAIWLFNAGVCWLLLRFGRPVLVVSDRGLRTRHGFRVQRIPWADITAFDVDTFVNATVSRRTAVLVAITRYGRVTLWGTQRPLGKIAELRRRVIDPSSAD